MLSKRRSIGEPLSWPRCDAFMKQAPALFQWSGRSRDPQVWALGYDACLTGTCGMAGTPDLDIQPCGGHSK